MFDTKRIAEITAREEAATPGPWRSQGNSYRDSYDELCPFVTGPNDENAICYIPSDYGNERANANFIAHARADIPFLLNLMSWLLEKLSQCAKCGNIDSSDELTLCEECTGNLDLSGNSDEQ